MSKKIKVVNARRGLSANGKYTESSARKVITSSGGTVGVETIYHPNPGLKVWSAMDALINYCGYRKVNKDQ